MGRHEDVDNIVVIKLGGSFITEKDKPFTFRERQTIDAISALKRSGAMFAIVHGGGSFGHPIALRYHLSGSSYLQSGVGVSETRSAMHQLSYMVYQKLEAAGFKPFLLHASSLIGHDGSPARGYRETISKLVETSLTPLSHGDVCLFKEGYKIVSGDQIAYLFCRALRPFRMIYVFDQPGILAKAGDRKSIIYHLTTDEVRDMTMVEGNDATGGLKNKLISASKVASMGIDTCFVSGFDTDGLIRAVGGLKFEGTLLQR